MPLFEVAVIQKPTKKELEDGIPEQLIMAPKAVLARDDKTAAIVALTAPDAPKIDYAKADVIVRPFV